MRNDCPFDFNGRTNLPFSVIVSWIRSIAGIKNIKLNEMLYVTHITFLDKYDKIKYIVIARIDFEKDPF